MGPNESSYLSLTDLENSVQLAIIKTYIFFLFALFPGQEELSLVYNTEIQLLSFVIFISKIH